MFLIINTCIAKSVCTEYRDAFDVKYPYRSTDERLPVPITQMRMLTLKAPHLQGAIGMTSEDFE